MRVLYCTFDHCFGDIVLGIYNLLVLLCVDELRKLTILNPKIKMQQSQIKGAEECTNAPPQLLFKLILIGDVGRTHHLSITDRLVDRRGKIFSISTLLQR